MLIVGADPVSDEGKIDMSYGHDLMGSLGLIYNLT